MLSQHGLVIWPSKSENNYTIDPKSVCPGRDLVGTRNLSFGPLDVFLGVPGDPWMIKLVSKDHLYITEEQVPGSIHPF